MKGKITRGTVKGFDPKTGYGFLIVSGDSDVFFNISDVKDRNCRGEIKKGVQVQCCLGPGKPGQRASNIVPIHH